MKHDANNKIEEKHKNKNNKYEYQTNLNVLFGKIKMEIPNLLIPDSAKQEKAVQRIMKIATTNLVKKDEILTDYLRTQIANIPTHKGDPHEITQKFLTL